MANGKRNHARQRAPRALDAALGRRVALASVIVIGSIALSRVSGMIRLMVFAAKFGVTAETSAYNQAFQIPDMVNMLIGGGVIASAFIPYFTEKLERGEEQAAWRTFSALFTLLSAALVGAVLVAEAAVPYIAGLFVPAKSFALPEQWLWVELTRTMLPAQICFVTGGLFMGALHARGHFLAPALGPIVYNLLIIAGIVALGDRYGVRAPAWAALCGAFVGQWLLMGPVLAAKGARLSLVFDFRDEGVRRVVGFMAPVIFGLSLVHINNLVARCLAGMVSEKAQTYFENAYRLAMLPIGMFGSGAGIAAYPSLAAATARGDAEQRARLLSASMRQVLYLTVPSALFLAVLREPIVAIMFERGQFTHDDTLATAAALACFALGVVALSVQQIVVRGFYACNDPRTPVKVGVGAVALNVGLALALLSPLKLPGLALATSLAAVGSVLALLWLLSRKIGAFGQREIAWAFARMVAAGALAAGAAWAALAWLREVFPSAGEVHKLLRCVLPLAIGGAAYLALCPVLGVREGGEALRMLLRRGE